MDTFSEIELRILSELEEASEESIASLLNTIIDPVGAPAEITTYQTALVRLVQLDCIRIAIDRNDKGYLRDLSKNQSLDQIREIANHLGYKPERKLWSDRRVVGPPFGDAAVYVVNTPSGKARGAEILQRLGYQWWLR